MREEFLHYLWKYCLYDEVKLVGSTDEKVDIIFPGNYNRDAGPDFFNAKIMMDGLIWAGNIEIHTKASCFDKHGHNNDKSYDNVILHIVDEYDKPVYSTSGREIPTAVLEYDNTYYEKYLDLINNPYTIACQKHLKYIDKSFIDSFLETLEVERLKEKSLQVKEMYNKMGNDWDEVLYLMIFRSIGLKTNADIYEMLAKTMPFKTIKKNGYYVTYLEALLFGASGLLDDEILGSVDRDFYILKLQKYFINFTKYNLVKPIHGWLWKYAKLRPDNFPTIRIAQLAALYKQKRTFYPKLLKCSTLKEMKESFYVAASNYWDNHYLFGEKSPGKPKKLGEATIDSLIINAVVPIMYSIGSNEQDQDLRAKAVQFLREMKPENNKKTRDWKSAGISTDSAYRSQALIQLRNNYCEKKRCLDCRIGCLIIEQGKKLIDNAALVLEP
jgi:hypothetical protein